MTRAVSRILYHCLASPECRKVRLALAEKQLDFQLQEENIWSLRDDFLKINLAGTVPVLVEDSAEVQADADANGTDTTSDNIEDADEAESSVEPVSDETLPAPTIIVGSATILEFLEETRPNIPLLPEAPSERAEARRVQSWFDEKFYAEVSGPLIFEKIESRKAGLGAPNMQVVRRALENIHYHLEYIGYLIEDRRWLAGDLLSVGDLAAAAHLSLLDYLGDVPWHKYDGAKEWYVRIKSRPSFRPLLAERIAGMPPSRHYANLDF